MRIFDLPRDRSPTGRPHRIVVTGSCRVHDPFEDLAAKGHLMKVWANYAAAPHSFGEAEQMLRYTLQSQDIEDALVPFVFPQPHSLRPRAPSEPRLLESADAFVVEISDLRQIRYGETYFQTNAFWRTFNARFSTETLPWYRALAQGHPAPDDVVKAIVEAHANRPAEERSFLESLLRHTVIERIDAACAATLIERICFNKDAKWLFVSHFMVPGMAGSQMVEREQLRAVLREAVQDRQVHMFDPSELVAEYGAEITLAVNGDDTNHYNPVFQATIAEAIVASIVGNGQGDASRRVRSSPAQRKGRDLNTILSTLHGKRLAELGEEKSGLYAHYRTLLERGDLVGQRPVAVAELVTRHLPAFERYLIPRAGLGETALLLAALGCRTAAFEDNSNRFAALQAGAAELRQQGLLEDGALECGTAFPAAPSDADASSGRTMAVLGHMVLSQPEGARSAMIDALAACDALLLDPASLLRGEGGADTSESTLALFRGLGFTAVREYPALHLAYLARPAPVRFDESSIDTAAASLNRLLVDCHKQRLVDLGLEGSGLYAHYELMLGRQTLVRERDCEIARVILAELAGFDAYDVLRGGLGELALLLSSTGLHVSMSEPDVARCKAAQAGLDYVVRAGFAADAAMKVAHGLLPQPVRPNTLAVATSYVFGIGEEAEGQYMGALAAYGAILLDPTRFLRMHQGPAEEERIADLLRAHGFSSLRRFAAASLMLASRPQSMAS
jgi:hypothetical protein